MMHPLPPGARPLTPAEITPAVTAWAIELLHDASLVMGAIAGPHTFGALTAVARVEVHTNGTATNPAPHPHRGISVYAVPSGGAIAMPAPVASVLGVDVSAYQPHVDWGQVAGAGYAFAIAKVTEGVTMRSPLYASQRDGARAAGLLVGAYHFFRTTSDPAVQARQAVELAAGTDLPLGIDVEDQHPTEPLGGLAPADFCERVRVCWAEAAQRSGRKPIAYVEPSLWAQLPPDAAARAAELAWLWVASYNPTPHIPHGWKTWDFWQFTAKGTVPGISGGEDVSRWRGSLEELRDFARARGRLVP